MTAVLQIIQVLEAKLTGHKIALPTFRIGKNGKPVAIGKTPKHVKQAKRAKADRKAKQWQKAGRKTT